MKLLILAVVYLIKHLKKQMRMKKKLLLPLLSVIFCAVAFTSCDDDDYYYDDTYLDRDLVGQWDLIFINGNPVSGFKQNFFDFYSDGSGKYYYYENGQQYWEWIDWWCYDGYYSPVLHINYSSGAPLNCSYSFNSDASRLYLSWTDSGGYRMEYVYAYTGSAQVSPRKVVEQVLRSGAAATDGNSESRPGIPEMMKQIPAKK